MIFFLKNRPIHFHINRNIVIRLVEQNQQSFPSIEINKQALAWRPVLSPTQSKKRGLVQAVKNLPLYKAAWADIACPKFSIACPEFILIDKTELILNWFF